MKFPNVASAVIGLWAILAVGFLAACSSSQPSIGQYGIVTGQGAFSDQQVKHVVAPGQHVKVGGADTTWYVPAQARNYVTAVSNGDRGPGTQVGGPQAVLTGPAKDGSPGLSVKAWTFVGIELNPAIEHNPTAKHSFANAFFGFCLKFGCATQTAQDTSENSSLVRSSPQGWRDMLNEVFPHAIDDATQTAAHQFGPDLWTQHDQWSAFATKIAAALPAELRQMSGQNDGLKYNYFCGTGSTASKCLPPVVVVNNVTPTDPAVQAAYNQRNAAVYQKLAGTARHEAAAAVYGPQDAGWFLGMQDLVDRCAREHVQCNFTVGNAPIHP